MAHTERKRRAAPDRMATFTDTMRGSGWLREAPANIFPEEWMKYRGRTALRQCIFLPPPGALPSAPTHKLAPVDTLVDPPRFEPRAPVYETPRAERRVARRPDKLRQVGLWPAYQSLAKREEEPLPPLPMRGAEWTSQPLALGLLLVCFPPAGLAAVWGSTRYDRDGKIALTLTTTIFMALLAMVVVTLAR